MTGHVLLEGPLAALEGQYRLFHKDSPRSLASASCSRILAWASVAAVAQLTSRFAGWVSESLLQARTSWTAVMLDKVLDNSPIDYHVTARALRNEAPQPGGGQT